MSQGNAGRMRFVVLGAGMAGILAGIKLREAGYRDVTIYEKADRLGGTWRENTYPGLTCDVPSHTYSYVFEPNPEWSQQLAPGAEIQAYLEGVAHKYDIDSMIRFNQEVIRCEYDGERWQLETKSGLREVLSVQDLYSGRMSEWATVRRTQGRVVEAEPIEGAGALMDIDGEQPGTLPARFEIRAGVVRIKIP